MLLSYWALLSPSVVTVSNLFWPYYTVVIKAGFNAVRVRNVYTVNCHHFQKPSCCSHQSRRVSPPVYFPWHLWTPSGLPHSQCSPKYHSEVYGHQSPLLGLLLYSCLSIHYNKKRKWEIKASSIQQCFSVCLRARTWPQVGKTKIPDGFEQWNQDAIFHSTQSNI